MAVIDRSTDVPVSAATAYRWWARPQRLAELLPDVTEVVSDGGSRSTWRLAIGSGEHTEWEIEKLGGRPARELRWRSGDDTPEHAGIVTFEPIDEENCQVRVRVAWRPRSVGQQVTHYLGVVDNWVAAALAESAHRLAERAERGPVNRSAQFDETEPEPVWPTEADVPAARPAQAETSLYDNPADAAPGTPGTPMGPTPPYTDPRNRPRF
ncbi:SRPBCC family protein [Actinoalloteichus sp. GBA129-24]|uniref:SRPBCC family protein n=1 Tax=Actinoalloteichus sp. GBA129-24 TaxID=1612551 RepID=UPI000950596F|nr:SRPBCC family protein [Actinoalloteichus sp. GBA129-24]APU22779.1 Polyketide cyclase / dehydrase and lipid transport [Actinoalloteichus sp. GBA129-24]